MLNNFATFGVMGLLRTENRPTVLTPEVMQSCRINCITSEEAQDAARLICCLEYDSYIFELSTGVVLAVFRLEIAQIQ